MIENFNFNQHMNIAIDGFNYIDASGNPVTQSVVGVTDSNGNPVTGNLFLLLQIDYNQNFTIE
jgi:hypothetical protein